MRVQENKRPGSGSASKAESTLVTPAVRRPESTPQPEAREFEDPFDYIT